MTQPSAHPVDPFRGAGSPLAAAPFQSKPRGSNYRGFHSWATKWSMISFMSDQLINDFIRERPNGRGFHSWATQWWMISFVSDHIIEDSSRPSKTQEFRGFILLRFLFTLSAKLDSLPRVWNFEVNFKNLAFISLSALGSWQGGWQVYKTRHLSAFLVFLKK